MFRFFNKIPRELIHIFGTVSKKRGIKKAVVLLSGGLDSTTVLAYAKSLNYEVYALSFNYGQRHLIELLSAKKIAKLFKVKKHLILNIELNKIGGSALTDKIQVPKNQKISKEIPITYVPARNLIFLSYATSWAEVLKANSIFIGANAIDYSNYPDCRLQFLKAFEEALNLGTKVGVEKNKITIYAPLIKLKKSEIIKLGIKLGIDYSLTHSCYDPNEKGLACGNCDSCQLRLKGFKEAKLIDTIKYRKD